jgi:hypothetical protein
LAARVVEISWSNQHGEIISQCATLQSDKKSALSVTVEKQPLVDSVAYVREAGFPYAVEILSVSPLDGGFRLDLEYASDGRRREHRTDISGAVTLESEGRTDIQAEVRNVSSGGLQLFAVQSLPAGNAVRVCGTDADYSGFVRHCHAVIGGHEIGVQFYGGIRKEVGNVQD